MDIFNFIMENYIITKDGRIIRKATNRELKAYTNEKGYKVVSIRGKKLKVHRLVAMMYIPNPNNKPQVNHKDGNKLNNNVSNLEWVTNYENRRHAIEHKLNVFGENCPWSKLTEDDIRFIRAHKTEYTLKQLAEMFNVNMITISDVVRNVTWKNVE